MTFPVRTKFARRDHLLSHTAQSISRKQEGFLCCHKSHRLSLPPEATEGLPPFLYFLYFLKMNLRLYFLGVSELQGLHCPLEGDPKMLEIQFATHSHCRAGKNSLGSLRMHPATLFSPRGSKHVHTLFGHLVSLSE